jgi:predicted DNA-binding protein (MmcQ/YjbR family)
LVEGTDDTMNVDTIREIALKLPYATEDVKWGADLCFCVEKKMFCVTGLHDGPVSLSFKAPDEDFEELCERPGFIQAPYMARHKWILIEDLKKVGKKELEKFIHGSYEQVKAKLPKKTQEKLGKKLKD